MSSATPRNAALPTDSHHNTYIADTLQPDTATVNTVGGRTVPDNPSTLPTILEDVSTCKERRWLISVGYRWKAEARSFCRREESPLDGSYRSRKPQSVEMLAIDYKKYKKIPLIVIVPSVYFMRSAMTRSSLFDRSAVDCHRQKWSPCNSSLQPNCEPVTRSRRGHDDAVRQIIMHELPTKSGTLDPIPMFLLNESIGALLPCMTVMMNTSLRTDFTPAKQTHVSVVHHVSFVLRARFNTK